MMSILPGTGVEAMTALLRDSSINYSKHRSQPLKVASSRKGMRSYRDYLKIS